MAVLLDELGLIEVPPVTPRRLASRGFSINGRALGELVDLGDLTCVLGGALDRTYERAYVRQLLGKARSELTSGRVPLYVCAECWDLGCGAVTVRVTELDDCFVWSELGHESPCSESPIHWRTREERDFYFSKSTYLGVVY